VLSGLASQGGPQVKTGTRSSKPKKLVSTSASTSATASPQVGTGYSTGGAPGFQKLRRGNNVGNIDRHGAATPPAGMFTPRKAPPTLLHQQAGGSVGSLQVSRREDTSSIAPTASSTASPGPTTREPSPRQGARTPGLDSSLTTSPGMPRFTPKDLSPGSNLSQSSTTTQIAPPLPLSQQQGRTRVPSPNQPTRGGPSGGLSPRATSPTGVPPLPLTTVASRGRLGLNSVTASTPTLATLPSGAPPAGAAPGALPRLARIAMGSSSSGPLVHRMVSPRGPTAGVGSPTPATGSHAPPLGTGSPTPRGNTHGAVSPPPRGPSASSASGAVAAAGLISPPGASTSYSPVVSETAGTTLHRQLSQSPRRFASPTPSSPRDGSLPMGAPPSLSVRAYSSGALLPRGPLPEAAQPSKE